MREGAHVVHTVRELHDEHSQVPGACDEESPHALRIAVYAAVTDMSELGDAFNKHRNLLAEFLFDGFWPDVYILNGIVEESRGNGGCAGAEFGKDFCGLKKMREIGLTGVAFVVFVRDRGKLIGLGDECILGRTRLFQKTYNVMYGRHILFPAAIRASLS